MSTDEKNGENYCKERWVASKLGANFLFLRASLPGVSVAITMASEVLQSFSTQDG